MAQVTPIPYKDVPGMFHLRWSDGTWSKDYYSETWAKEHCDILNREYDAPETHREARTDVSTGAPLPPYLKTFKLTSDAPRALQRVSAQCL